MAYVDFEICLEYNRVQETRAGNQIIAIVPLAINFVL